MFVFGDEICMWRIGRIVCKQAKLVHSKIATCRMAFLGNVEQERIKCTFLELHPQDIVGFDRSGTAFLRD